MTPNSTTQTAPPEVLTATEVALRLRITPAHVRRLAAAGDLPGRRIGGSWRFSRSAIVALLPDEAAAS